MMNLARAGSKVMARVGKVAVSAPTFRGLATVAENTIKITFVDNEVKLTS